MRQAQPGDEALFYHTGSERAIVGIDRVEPEPYPDPELGHERIVVFDLSPRERLRNPVSLASIGGRALSPPLRTPPLRDSFGMSTLGLDCLCSPRRLLSSDDSLEAGGLAALEPVADPSLVPLSRPARAAAEKPQESRPPFWMPEA
jgi:hypothetical protein